MDTMLSETVVLAYKASLYPLSNLPHPSSFPLLSAAGKYHFLSVNLT